MGVGVIKESSLKILKRGWANVEIARRGGGLEAVTFANLGFNY